MLKRKLATTGVRIWQEHKYPEFRVIYYDDDNAKLIENKKGRCALDDNNQIAIDDLTKRYM